MTRIFKLKEFNRNVPVEALLANMESVWIRLGRQPVFRDMKPPLSKYSAHTYIARFGSWLNSLQIFIQSVNVDATTTYQHPYVSAHITPRSPCNKLKIQVLMRDGNICNKCGRPIMDGNLHFDHIHPWSKGGETTLSNLQILCANCNWSKGANDPCIESNTVAMADIKRCEEEEVSLLARPE